jgi:hypothetical protein
MGGLGVLYIMSWVGERERDCLLMVWVGERERLFIDGMGGMGAEMVK